MDRHHQAWDTQRMVDKFSAKQEVDFFHSERRFLERIGGNVESVLDVGCACGRFIELLGHYGWRPDYCGLDLSPKSIAIARDFYPNAVFHLTDALAFHPGRTFHLVNATGVMQHEPRFRDLVRHMTALASRYILFDVKLADIDSDLVDVDRAYGRIGDDRLYFIVLNWPGLRRFLESLDGISRISVFGYETPRNAVTTLPDDVGPLVSASVLLERGDGPPAIDTDLPDFLL